MIQLEENSSWNWYRQYTLDFPSDHQEKKTRSTQIGSTLTGSAQQVKYSTGKNDP